jgi:integrase
VPRPRKDRLHVPDLLRHRPTQRARVRLNGHDRYLGPWPNDQDEPPLEVKAAYDRLIAEWLACGRRPVEIGPPAGPNRPDREPGGPSVAEVILAFWRFAEGHYRDAEGEPTGELENYRLALRPLREMYGAMAAADFTPLKLKALREHWIATRLCRGVVNARVAKVRRVFKWAVAEELVPPATYQGLQAVGGLQRGRSPAREPDPVEPVAGAVVDATLPHLNREVAGMVRLQLLTGMRPGEVCGLMAGQLDRSGAIWVYRPKKHKTAYRGKARVVCLGPRAQEVLLPFLRVRCPLCGACDRPHRIAWKGDLCGPCADRMAEAGVCGPWPPAAAEINYRVFTPRDAVQDRALELRAKRKTKVQPSQANRRAKTRRRPPGEKYTRHSYNNALDRACERAFPVQEHLAPGLLDGGRRESRAAWWARLTAEEKAEVRAWRQLHRWHPNQLRHTHGSEVRKRYGLEAAQVALGHEQANITQIYAERDLSLAERVAREIG